jgi:hypothetical protein
MMSTTVDLRLGQDPRPALACELEAADDPNDRDLMVKVHPILQPQDRPSCG